MSRPTPPRRSRPTATGATTGTSAERCPLPPFELEKDRLADLEQRLRALEDERAVARLIASYGPFVDSGSAERTAALWESDGDHDIEGVSLNGAAAIAAMVRSDAHQEIITGGSAHFLGPHRITVEGDDAEAVGCSLLVRREDGRFVVARATAHRWRSRRGPEGWRVAHRAACVLDGRAEARELLASKGR